LHFGLNGVGPTGLEPSVGQIWNPQSCDLAKMRTAGCTGRRNNGPRLVRDGLDSSIFEVLGCAGADGERKGDRTDPQCVIPGLHLATLATEVR